jgi:ribonuclease HII
LLDRLKFEKEALSSGAQFIAGVDEVGMGCLAGPVVAAAVILDLSRVPDGIDDSKKLSEKRRVQLDKAIRETCLSFSIQHATVEEIDSLNIFHAAKLAMVRAVNGLKPRPDFLLIDGKFGIPHPLGQKCLVKGDQLSVSIGAASIIAKVYRDAWMKNFDEAYPGYGFAGHKGYGSVEHRTALDKMGRSPIHRKTFSWTPV